MEDNKELEKRALRYKDEFYKIASRILADYPEKKEVFEKNWSTNFYRKAYLPYMEVKHQNNIVLSEEEEKINREFYGLFVN